jgi:hypothetical protein
LITSAAFSIRMLMVPYSATAAAMRLLRPVVVGISASTTILMVEVAREERPVEAWAC